MRGYRLMLPVVILLAAVPGRMDVMAAGAKSETATLAGGCFWCMEAIFEEMDGIENVESGFSGGDDAATYKEVCTGKTGHAEVVNITYDPARTSFRDILTVFFTMHDPTTLNRQGADVGTQYRSAIFYHNEQQKKLAEEAIRTLTEEKVYPRPIVTEVSPFTRFFKADEHHQNYYRRNKNQGYCQAVINPKLQKFRHKFADRLKN